MIRTHKIALNPSPTHLRLLERHADSAREAYNYALAHFEETLEAENPCPVSMLFPMWKSIRESSYPHFHDLSPNAAQYAVYALEDAIKASQDNTRDNEFPKAHGADHRPAFRANKGKGEVSCEGKRIKLPKIGNVRMRESLRLEGSIATVTVTCEAGRWWACVTVGMKDTSRCPGTTVIGIDVGVRWMAVCSDGTRYEVPEALRHEWRRIGRYRRQLARQVPGSNRQARVRRKLEKASWRAKCIRDDAHYKVAREIVAKGDAMVLESLDITDMMQKGARWLAKGIAAAAMSGLQRKIADRCEALGVKLIRAEPGFPSTRRCSGCKALQDMPLGKRIYDCPTCPMSIDRDDNAALNLQHYGEERI